MSEHEKNPHHCKGEECCQSEHKGHDEKKAPLGAGSASDASELKDRLLRTLAEFDNYKKRTDGERVKLRRMAEAGLILRMLPNYEELKMAESEVQGLAGGPVKSGVLLVLGKMRMAFEKEGLSEMKVEAGGKPDPFRHEVMMSEKSDLPEGAIVKEIQKGYLFRGEVLRCARVSVSAEKTHDGGKADGKEKEAKADDAPGKEEPRKKETHQGKADEKHHSGKKKGD